MANSKSKNRGKPTVFLSHSSNNRRELLALKRFLDERAGGFVEFFLSSDEESIIHGTIWPTEVKAALDRMQLMLIFASTDALKAGWTYFEAGYGLHKLGTTNIYCLPGTDKASLPSPFNLIQNRNVHSARDVSLLIKQINDLFGSKMAEAVSKDEFDRIFKKPVLGIVETAPKFDQLVEEVKVEAMGSYNSIEIFADVCRNHNLAFSKVVSHYSNREDRCSTGIRISVETPEISDEWSQLEVTDDMLEDGKVKVREYSEEQWEPPGRWGGFELKTVAEVKAYNARILKKNQQIQNENTKALAEPRACEFILSPINISLPITTVDHWLEKVEIITPVIVHIQLASGVKIESKQEAISAKIHGSQLSLREDGNLQWVEHTILKLDSSNRVLKLEAADTNLKTLSKFQIQDLVSILFELNILVVEGQKKKRR
jgi:hypothetical protein